MRPLPGVEGCVEVRHHPQDALAVANELLSIALLPIGLPVREQSLEQRIEAIPVAAQRHGFAKGVLPSPAACKPSLHVAGEGRRTFGNDRALAVVQPSDPTLGLAAQQLLASPEPLRFAATARLGCLFRVLLPDTPEHFLDLRVVERGEYARRLRDHLPHDVVPESVEHPAGVVDALIAERRSSLFFQLAEERRVAPYLRLAMPGEQQVDAALELPALSGVQFHVVAEVPWQQYVELAIEEPGAATAGQHCHGSQQRQPAPCYGLDSAGASTANHAMGFARPHGRTRTGLRRTPTCLLLVFVAISADSAQAANRVMFAADSVEWAGIRAHGVNLVLRPHAQASADLTFYAAVIDGIATVGRIESLAARCPEVSATSGHLTCATGRLAGHFGALGPQDTAVTTRLAGRDSLELALPGLRVAGGTAALEVESRAGGWTAVIETSELSLAELTSLPPTRDLVPAGVVLSGSMAGSIRLQGRAATLGAAGGSVALRELGFANEAGTLAGEGLSADLSFELQPLATPDGWRLECRYEVPAGQAYAEPVFLDFADHPVSGAAAGRLSSALDSLALQSLHVRQRGVGTVTGTAVLTLGAVPALSRARLHLEDVDVGGVLRLYAAPALISTDFADIVGAGVVAGEVDVDGGLPSRLELALDQVLIDSVSGALSVEGLAGRFSWFNDELRNELAPQVDSELFKSRLAWSALRLWGVEFGPAEVPFTTTGRHFRLLDPVVLPVFDGGLAVDTLRIRHAGTPRMYVRFDAELQPISLARVARAFGWPEFSGTLAGRIPTLELADGLVTLGGNLEAQVFDGRITLGGLRMRDPLGQYPQLFADIEIESLDLQQITSTFEFGMITGRLSGFVRELEMFDWMPVAFEARLFTAPGDRSPHRISQRAVTNLSSIGGGSGGSVAAALQSGFLRFFDSFRYDRLGLSCTLANDVCHMEGIEAAPGGYYIVKGSGLPRIDVIGNQQRVAWTRLVRQLGAITQSAGPVVQ